MKRPSRAELVHGRVTGLTSQLALFRSSQQRGKVRHRDVVRVALDRLERDLRGQGDVMLDFYNLEHKSDKDSSSGVREAGGDGRGAVRRTSYQACFRNKFSRRRREITCG